MLRRTLVYEAKAVPHPGSLKVQLLRTQLVSVLSVNISMNPFVIITVEPLGLYGIGAFTLVNDASTTSEHEQSAVFENVYP